MNPITRTSLLVAGLVSVLCSGLSGQSSNKKRLEIEDLVQWRRIQSPELSNDGQWAAYTLDAEVGDPEAVLYDGATGRSYRFERGDRPRISADGRFAVFMIHPPLDTLKDMRRRKVEKNKLPKDTLAIYDLQQRKLEKVAEVRRFVLPEKWPGWLAYIAEPEPDTTASRKKQKEAPGRLVIRNLSKGGETTISRVNGVTAAEEGAALAFVKEEGDPEEAPGVYIFDGASGRYRPVFRAKGSYKQLEWDKPGKQLAFIGDIDTTKAKTRPFGLYYWRSGPDTARCVLKPAATFLPEHWLVSENADLQFSKDGQKLYFGIAPPPVLQDTMLLPEEIVQVEVWTYNDSRLYTQQESQLERDKKKSYDAVFHTGSGKLVQLATEQLPDVNTGDEGNAPFALGYNQEPYLKETSWEGGPTRKDVYLLDVQTGKAKEIGKAVAGQPAFSPGGKVVIWYSAPDSAWMAYPVTEGKQRRLTDNKKVAFYEEDNDVPALPGPYGIAGFLPQDQAVVIYDRYDLWQMDPAGKAAPRRITQGRENKRRLRYIDLNPDVRFIDPAKPLLLHFFEEDSKKEGYLWLDWNTGKTAEAAAGDYTYSMRPVKARNADRYLYTRENFQTFPDLRYGATLESAVRISEANPQQKDYNWGTIELVKWTSLDGKELEGMLVKPEGFDPKKKYPMIVNFYEKSSDGLYSHRAPFAHRSTINYTYYASRGYLIFNPDIPYKEGYPGESAFNSVISGVTSLVNQGFVDEKRIAGQGHSWGGYQIAYLVTKTDIFRCVEAGAPVVNMISAYGGIRWESGMSRMFQYEKTQSRIGGTLWEYPLRFISNSPIFEIDKINTPVLILHNDEDGAVPWYQGIEFFTAMRRLNKPAWMLVYNGEPHWPVKLQNRIDFNRRMSQYFDYFLQDAPMPAWMANGVSPIEKGIHQGYEPAGQPASAPDRRN